MLRPGGRLLSALLEANGRGPSSLHSPPSASKCSLWSVETWHAAYGPLRRGSRKPYIGSYDMLRACDHLVTRPSTTMVMTWRITSQSGYDRSE